MTAVLCIAFTVLVLLLAAGAGLLVGCVSIGRAQRRQLDVLAERLMAESRIEASTRETLQRMRDAARTEQRGNHSAPIWRATRADDDLRNG